MRFSVPFLGHQPKTERTQAKNQQKTKTDSILSCFTGEPTTRNRPKTNRPTPNQKAETISEQNLRERENPRREKVGRPTCKKRCKKETQPKGPPYVEPKPTPKVANKQKPPQQIQALTKRHWIRWGVGGHATGHKQ